jgi:hypothetical protein
VAPAALGCDSSDIFCSRSVASLQIKIGRIKASHGKIEILQAKSYYYNQATETNPALQIKNCFFWTPAVNNQRTKPSYSKNASGKVNQGRATARTDRRTAHMGPAGGRRRRRTVPAKLTQTESTD